MVVSKAGEGGRADLCINAETEWTQGGCCVCKMCRMAAC
jgi:hypothetical protein